MKTNELTGAALNWAVGVAESLQWQDDDPEVGLYHRRDYQYRNDRLVLNALDYDTMDDWSLTLYSPSTDWSQGGPIIEREGITIARRGKYLYSEWGAVLNDFEFDEDGPTPLIAAMRCYVASKMGDEINLPKELT
jgi:hypothetical protein